MKDFENEIMAKVSALVGDYIPTNEPRNAQLARLLGREMVNVRRQAFIEAAEIAGDFGPSRPMVSKTPSDLVKGRWEGEQAASANIAAALRAKAEETQG